MAETPLRRALTGFPAVQEPRDALRSLQQTVINIRERLRQIEAQTNLGLTGGNAITGNPFPEAPADGNIYGRRNRAWTIVKLNGLRFTYDTEPPDLAAGNEGDEWMESDTAILYTLVDDGSKRQWVELAGVGQGPDGSGYVRADIYDTPGSYTWVKAAGATYVEAVLAGGGGGGGAGGIFYTFRCRGGSGGGGGALVQFGGPADSFGPTEAVEVAAGGLYGSGFSGTFPLYIGNNGSPGGDSSFAGIIAYGGGAGEGGSNAADWGGGGAGAAGPGGNAGQAGSLGGVPGGLDDPGGSNENPIGGAGGSGPSSDFAGQDGGYAFNGGQGGGSGGPGNEYNTYFAGGDAYEWGAFSAPTVLGGTTSLDPARNGGSAGGLAPSLRGAGGAGGAGASNGTTAGYGGDGQQPGGGGGGGGGAGGSSANPNRGGSGGNGIVIVLTYF